MYSVNSVQTNTGLLVTRYLNPLKQGEEVNNISKKKDRSKKTYNREKNEEFLNTILENTRNILAEEYSGEIHPIFVFIKQFTDLISIQAALCSFKKERIAPDIYMANIFECGTSKISSSLIKRAVLDGNNSNKFTKNNYIYFNESLEFELKEVPLIVNPWNYNKVTRNISTASPNDLTENSVMNTYYYPVGVVICNSGNHSQYPLSLKGEGVTYAKEIINTEELYQYATFDGNEFIYEFPSCHLESFSGNYTPKSEVEFYAGIIFEIGRILMKKPSIFPSKVIEVISNQ